MSSTVQQALRVQAGDGGSATVRPSGVAQGRAADKAPTARAARQRAEDLRVGMGRIVFALVCLAAWEAASRWLVDPFWIGRPSQIALRLAAMVTSGDLWWHTLPTLWQAAAGLLLSLAAGIPIGLLFATNRYIERVLEPFFLGLYSIPRIALAPLFILWFGIGPSSKIVMAFSMVVFVVILNTYEGVRGIDRELIDMMRAMRAPRGYILRKVMLPGIVPWLFASVRVGVGLALIGSVVGELLGANRGLGWYVEHAAARIDVTGVFTGLVVLMAVGMILNELVKVAERRLFGKR
ncbi:MAG TPA: ABC transporter permease [Bordetella sp.]|jgi:NitT/TauT family transport system permease protein|nr:ABC transporter permease [Bordetella sp.]